MNIVQREMDKKEEAVSNELLIYTNTDKKLGYNTRIIYNNNNSYYYILK